MMKNKKNTKYSTEEKVCKKCGEPLRSKSKYDLCDNCRRERAKARKEIGGALLSLAGIAFSFVPVVKKFKKK